MIYLTHTEMLDSRAAVVEIAGPLNGTTSPDVEEYINALMQKNIVFILADAGRLEYVSSAGIGLMLLLQQKIAAANGFFVLFNLPEEIASLYRILGFDKVFKIVSTRAEAIQVMDRQMELRTNAAPAPPAESTVREPKPAPVTPVPVISALGAGTSGSAPAVPASEARAWVVECPRCAALVRVRGAGGYLCPECNTEFTAAGDETRGYAVTAGHQPGRPVEPFVVECARCRALVRVNATGAQACPGCGARFQVRDDLTVSFN